MRRHVVASFVVLTLALTPELGADWLVTRQGNRVETKGPWTVRGRLVVFTAANGQLASLRADEVDLAASAIATSEALAPKDERPKETPRAVLRLTDDDVGHIDPSDLESESETAEPAADESPTGPTQSPERGATQLAVSSWEQAEDGSGVTIVGRLANPTDSTATAISMLVVAFDAGGRQIARGNATISTTALPSGQDAEFRISFPEISRFSSLRFQPQATLFKANPTPPRSDPAAAAPAATPVPGEAEGAGVDAGSANR